MHFVLVLRQRPRILDECRGAAVIRDVLRKVLQIFVELFDNFRVRLDDVLRFTDVTFEIVQLSGTALVDVQFPIAGSNSLESLTAMIKEGVMRCFGFAR